MIYRKLILKVSDIDIKFRIEPPKIYPMKLPPKAPSKPSNHAKTRSRHELEANVDDRVDVYSQASGEIFTELHNLFLVILTDSSSNIRL
jgi:hypothetical protein